jgi:hypothetical protein
MWCQEMVWTFWTREISLILAENRTSIVPTRSLVTTVTELPRLPPRSQCSSECIVVLLGSHLFVVDIQIKSSLSVA